MTAPIILFVEDLTKSLEFYRHHLGLKEHRVANEKAKALNADGTILVLIEAGEPVTPQEHPFHTFAVEDVAKFDERTGRDPDGHLFAVTHRKRQEDIHGIVLSGGGSYGAFELGVLRKLATDARVGVGCTKPAVLAGTSVGAFNAAVLACRMSEREDFCDAVADLSTIWTKSVGGDLHDNGVFRVRGDLLYSVNSGLPQWPIRAMAAVASDAAFMALDVIERVRHLREPSKLFDLSAAFCTDPLVSLIRRHVSWRQLVQSPCSLRVVTTNWTTGRPCEFAWQPKPGRGERHTHPDVVALNEKNLCSAVEASTAIPGVFRPVHVPGNNGRSTELFVDGGLVMNSPIDPAIEAGANVIHLICLNPDVSTMVLSPLSNTAEVVQRSLTATVASHIASDLALAALINSAAGVARRPNSDQYYRPLTVHRYHPSTKNLGGFGGMLNFTVEHLQQLIAEGEAVFSGHDCERDGCVLPGRHR